MQRPDEILRTLFSRVGSYGAKPYRRLFMALALNWAMPLTGMLSVLPFVRTRPIREGLARVGWPLPSIIQAVP